MNGFIDGFQNYISGAPALAFAAAFAAGVLTSLTPCVYPMIPVTVAYIGGSSSGRSPMRGFVLSASYVLGLAAAYSALGAFAALTGRMFGQWVAHPAVNIGIGVIFVLLGLSMLDVFALPMPGFLTGGAKRREGGSVAGAFSIGVASAFVAAPCTAPVLFSILTFVAGRQNAAYGIALLFSFALGLGLILVVVGTFAAALGALPKSGAWMVKIKSAFGILMIAVSCWFLYTGVRAMIS